MQNIQFLGISRSMQSPKLPLSGMLFKAQILSGYTYISGLHSLLPGTLSALTLCNHFLDCLGLLIENIRST